MHTSTIFLSPSEYFILNKSLIKKTSLEATLVLSELITIESKSLKKGPNGYFFTTINNISDQTTLSEFKIKNAINQLYKKKFIEVLVIEKSKKIKIKIIHTNILNDLMLEIKTSNSFKKKNKVLIKKNRFKKPTLKELKKYFLELGNIDESEIMFDYYESKGWKVGKAPMKCWKSAARNWIRRLNTQFVFPNFYDKQFELKISADSDKLLQYHKHLQQLGWESMYSPSSGKTWKKIKS